MSSDDEFGPRDALHFMDMMEGTLRMSEIGAFNAECRGLIEVCPYVGEDNVALIVSVLRVCAAVDKLATQTTGAAQLAKEASKDVMEMLDKVAEFEAKMP